MYEARLRVGYLPMDAWRGSGADVKGEQSMLRSARPKTPIEDGVGDDDEEDEMSSVGSYDDEDEEPAGQMEV